MQATLEERVAYLEGKVEEHSKVREDLKDSIINLDGKVDRRIDALEQRITQLDIKFDNKINALDQKFDNKIDTLDQKFSRYFLWIIGIQVTIFLAILSTLLKS